MGVLTLGLNGRPELIGLGPEPVGLRLELGLEGVVLGLLALERIDPSRDSARPLRLRSCFSTASSRDARDRSRVVAFELLATLRESPPE